MTRPKERLQTIRDQVEATLARQKDLDHHWEDQVDVRLLFNPYMFAFNPYVLITTPQSPYQSLPVPYASKLFKYIPLSSAPSRPSSSSDKTDDDRSPSPQPLTARAVRLRHARSGRLYLDRYDAVPRPISKLPRSSLFALGENQEMEVDEDPEGLERRRRLEERWKYDIDDLPSAGPEGVDEQDRILVDDYSLP